jgi:hypothetical protein
MLPTLRPTTPRLVTYFEIHFVILVCIAGTRFAGSTDAASLSESRWPRRSDLEILATINPSTPKVFFSLTLSPYFKIDSPLIWHQPMGIGPIAALIWDRTIKLEASLDFG